MSENLSKMFDNPYGRSGAGICQLLDSGRPIRRKRSWNRASDARGSKAGRSTIDAARAATLMASLLSFTYKAVVNSQDRITGRRDRYRNHFMPKGSGSTNPE
jgi:hypothetical protein